MEETFERKRHVKYFERCLQVIPGQYASLDTSRLTVAFFAISGLDLLDALNEVKLDKKDTIDWIYSMQILPLEDESNISKCGFRGSSSIGVKFNNQDEVISCDSAHVAMTYTALASLIILGDDLSRINREAIAAGLTKLQLSDGSFSFTIDGSENDMRFLYCVACTCYMIKDFSSIDVDKAVNYIVSSLSYEGAFGQGPHLEAHGGSTFCAVASLCLFGRLHNALSEQQISSLKRWCVLRQQSGFQGRPNKPVDTCYSFWIGATLALLDAYDLSNAQCNRAFLLSTQDYVIGGFSKWTTTSPDPLHSYMGLAGLSLLGETTVQPLFAPLNISKRAASHLHEIQSQWKS